MPRPMREEDISTLYGAAKACCELQVAVHEMEIHHPPGDAELELSRARLARLDEIVELLNSWSEPDRHRARHMLEAFKRGSVREDATRLARVTGGNRCYRSAGAI